MKVKLYTVEEFEKAKREAYCAGYNAGFQQGTINERLNQFQRELNPWWTRQTLEPYVTCSAVKLGMPSGDSIRGIGLCR